MHVATHQVHFGGIKNCFVVGGGVCLFVCLFLFFVFCFSFGKTVVRFCLKVSAKVQMLQVWFICGLNLLKVDCW